MANYLTNSEDLKTVADAIRSKTGGTSNISYPSEFASEIASIGVYQTNGATAGDILSGKKAYVGTSTIEGTIESKAAETYSPSGEDNIVIESGKYLSGDQTIRKVTTTNLTATNIKDGVVVKIGDSSDDDCVTSVTGSYTHDANATANDIRQGVSAYVQGQKINGGVTVTGTQTYNNSTSNIEIPAGWYSGKQIVRGVSISSSLKAENIKEGVVVTVGDTGNSTRFKNITGECVPVTLSLTQNSNCFIPFMFKCTDNYPPAIYRGDGGFFISGGGSGTKQFIVPCKIKMTFYDTDTALSTSTVTFKTGTTYSLGPVNNTVAAIQGGGLNTTVWKITKFEMA